MDVPTSTQICHLINQPEIQNKVKNPVYETDATLREIDKNIFDYTRLFMQDAKGFSLSKEEFNTMKSYLDKRVKQVSEEGPVEEMVEDLEKVAHKIFNLPPHL